MLPFLPLETHKDHGCQNKCQHCSVIMYVCAPLFLKNSLCCVLISLQYRQRLGMSDRASMRAVSSVCVCVCIFAAGITCVACYSLRQTMVKGGVTRESKLSRVLSRATSDDV